MAQLLQAVFDGFSSFEKVFWIPEYGPLKGKITLRKLAHRPADTVTFVAHDDGSFGGIRQHTFSAGKEIDTLINDQYAFYFAAQEEERKFYGISYFQSAYYHYDKKQKLYYVAHLAAQRAAVGTRSGTYPAGATKDQRALFSRHLANLSVAQWMSMPEGFKVELLKEGGSFDFLNLINHHNAQMSKSILASFFDQTQGGGSNDSAVVNFAEPGNEMFILMLRAIMDEIASQINFYIIPQLVDFNFKSQKFPKFTWGKLTDEQRAAVAALFSKVAVGGQSVNLPKEFTRAMEKQQAGDLGLDVDWDEVEKREEEEAAEAKAQQEAMAAAQAMPPGGAPGAPAPPEATSEEAQLAMIESFEDKISGLKAEDGEVQLTAEAALLVLAKELLDVAGQQEDE
jgi:phage gp29-like protein